VYYIADSVKNEIKNQGLFEPGDQPINLEGTSFLERIWQSAAIHNNYRSL
jgi:hypothetical protein